MLSSSRIVSGGFLGHDNRSYQEIIDSDLAEVQRLGFTAEDIAARMQELTELAAPGLGTWVDADDSLKVCARDDKGSIICPWPHPGKFFKRITTVRDKTGRTIRWTDLNIHMIAEHGFFEGKGSIFRVEPAKLAEIIL